MNVGAFMMPVGLSLIALIVFAMLSTDGPVRKPPVIPQGGETYRATDGPNRIGHRMQDLQDDKRGKALPIRVTYPVSGGPYPVIVFSHGYLGSRDAYGPLVDYWASWGYVVIQPSHDDSIQLRMQRGQKIPPFREGLSGWADRARDITFLLDLLPAVQHGLPVAMDAGAVGMGGHSFGAGTTELIGGTHTRDDTRLSDPRPKALLMISPQGVGKLYSREAWRDLTRPTMVISGSNDLGMGRVPETRKDPFLLSPAGDKYLVWIDGAYHGFGGITGALKWPGAGPADPNEVLWVKMATLAFWDGYLKADKAGKTYLAGKGLPDYSRGRVELSRR